MACFSRVSWCLSPLRFAECCPLKAHLDGVYSCSLFPEVGSYLTSETRIRFPLFCSLGDTETPGDTSLLPFSVLPAWPRRCDNTLTQHRGQCAFSWSTVLVLSSGLGVKLCSALKGKLRLLLDLNVCLWFLKDEGEQLALLPLICAFCWPFSASFLSALWWLQEKKENQVACSVYSVWRQKLPGAFCCT